MFSVPADRTDARKALRSQARTRTVRAEGARRVTVLDCRVSAIPHLQRRQLRANGRRAEGHDVVSPKGGSTSSSKHCARSTTASKTGSEATS